jgi:hypothetical protein
MAEHADWISSAITKARERCAVVPDIVWQQFEPLLKGRFSERAIPAKELATIATQLVGAMVPIPPDVEKPE